MTKRHVLALGLAFLVFVAVKEGGASLMRSHYQSEFSLENDSLKPGPTFEASYMLATGRRESNMANVERYSLYLAGAAALGMLLVAVPSRPTK